MPGEARRRLTGSHGFLRLIRDGGRSWATNHPVLLDLTRSAVQAGRRAHEVTARAFQSDTVDTARLVMGEFPHRLAIFRMGFGSCDERARARLCVSGCQRSVSTRTFGDGRDPLERWPICASSGRTSPLARASAEFAHDAPGTATGFRVEAMWR
jgi:hypothetical protein